MRTFAKLAALVLAGFAALFSASVARAAPFDGWAGAIIAGDYRAHSGAPAEVFDNARRDLAAKLIGMGFAANNVRTFSTRPNRYADAPLRSEVRTIGDTLKQMTLSARAGCFVYFTSHGAPNGIVIGDYLVSPSAIGEIIDDACGNRPSVLVFSACYSGVFIAPLATENRMILTAARPDRTSFGCSEDLNYTFFDQCVLQALPNSPTFLELAEGARACVDAREIKEGLTPPSEPQLYLGDNLARLLKFYPVSAPLPTRIEIPQPCGGIGFDCSAPATNVPEVPPPTPG